MELNATQIWVLVGVPALVLAVSLFLTRSAWRSTLAYLVLLAAFITIALVDSVAGAVFGVVVALLYGAGRGGNAESGHDPLGDVAGHTGPLTQARDA